MIATLVNSYGDDNIHTDRGGTMPNGKLVQDLQRMREEGFNEGLNKGRQEIVDWLQNAYLGDDGRPDRGSPKAEAILELARDASKHFRGLVDTEKKNGRRR